MRGLTEDGGEARAPFDPRSDRKTLQLCRQVYRALSVELGGDGDEALREVSVEAVEPLGGAGQLLVRVVVPVGVPPLEVMARLEARTPALRASVASAICRKRVPMLTFVAVPAAEGGAL